MITFCSCTLQHKRCKAWAPASAGMTDRGLACPQFPQKLRATTLKRFRDYNTVLTWYWYWYSSSNSFPNWNAGNRRSSPFLTSPRVLLAAVAASNHVSIHLAPSHWNSCHWWPFQGSCATCPSADLGVQPPRRARFPVNRQGESGNKFQCPVIKLCLALVPGASAIPFIHL